MEKQLENSQSLLGTRWRELLVHKVLLAMLEEEEGEQDLAREQLRRVILVLGMVPVGVVAAGRGGSVYRHSPRAHQLAFSPPLCCPTS